MRRLLCLIVAGCSSGSSAPPQPIDATYETQAVTCRVRGERLTCEWREPRAAALVAPGVAARQPAEVPVPEAVTAVSISPLDSHACALTRSGAVYCWGNNEYGQAGVAAATAIVFPPSRIEDIGPAKAISTSGGSSCAAGEQGSLRCWGSLSSAGMKGVTDTPRAIQMPVSGVLAVAAELTQTCALDADGARCWGGYVADRVSGRQLSAFGIRAVDGTRGASRLGAEIGRVCAIWTDGQEKCWSTTPMPLRP